MAGDGKRKLKTDKELQDAWEAFKFKCDNRIVLTHEFSAKNSEFVSKDLQRCTTYTINEFCEFIHLTRSAFYANYANKETYKDTVTRMQEECENDARKKFELGVIPTQLSGLWMSKYGYTAKTETNLSGEGLSVKVVIREPGKDE